MQKASITFLILSLLCGIMGFSGIAVLSFGFARIMFLFFLALFTITGFIYVLSEPGPMR